MKPDDGTGVFGCRPLLCVDNVARSPDYYANVLGFHVGLTWSDKEQRFLSPGETIPPNFAIIGLGEVQLMLVERSQGQPGMWIHIDIHTADQLDRLYERWKEKEARIIEPPLMRPWGMYEMRVQDLDQHVFRISAPPRAIR